MTDVIHAADEAGKGAGQLLDALGKLLPEIPSRSRGRAAQKNIKTYAKERHWLESSDLLEGEKKIALVYLQRELLHADNTYTIVCNAAPQIDEDANVDDMDPDWIDDFMGKAERISDKEVQRLWSKLLAEEVNNHGTFSKKTMATLYELDTETATTFSQYCKYAVRNEMPSVIGNYIPLSHKGYSTHRYDILSEYQLKMLEEAGLITQQHTSDLFVQANSTEGVLLTKHYELCIVNDEDTEFGFAFSSFQFTKVGDQLCNLCDWGTAQNIEDIIKSLLPTPPITYYFTPRKVTSKVSANKNGTSTVNNGCQNEREQQLSFKMKP